MWSVHSELQYILVMLTKKNILGPSKIVLHECHVTVSYFHSTCLNLKKHKVGLFFCLFVCLFYESFFLWIYVPLNNCWQLYIDCFNLLHGWKTDCMVEAATIGTCVNAACLNVQWKITLFHTHLEVYWVNGKDSFYAVHVLGIWY